jgi:hypothetical protein
VRKWNCTIDAKEFHHTYVNVDNNEDTSNETRSGSITEQCATGTDDWMSHYTRDFLIFNIETFGIVVCVKLKQSNNNTIHDDVCHGEKSPQQQKTCNGSNE